VRRRVSPPKASQGHHIPKLRFLRPLRRAEAFRSRRLVVTLAFCNFVRVCDIQYGSRFARINVYVPCLTHPIRGIQAHTVFKENIIKTVWAWLPRINVYGTILTMLEDQQQVTEPVEVSEQDSVANKRYLALYVMLGLLAALLVGVGTWLGLQYFKSAPEQVLQDNASEIKTTQFNLTEAELKTAKTEVLSSLQLSFGFTETVGSDLYIDNKNSNPTQSGDETLHNMRVDVEPFQGVLDAAGDFIAQEQIPEIYWSQSKEINSGNYGSVLVGTADILSLPLVSWVSFNNNVPLILSVSFNVENVEVNDLQLDFTSKAPLLLKSILEKYPPDSDLTKSLISGIDSLRSQNRGYATTKILREESNSDGYKFTLTEFDNSKVSNSCDMFVSGWPLERAKELVSCEVKIKINATEQTYTDEQLMTLGGLPDGWISGDEIVTSRTEGGEGLGETGYSFVGTFNADTKKYTQVLEIERPGFYWRRALVDYEFGNVKKRLLFVEGADAYFLYELQTDRDLSEYFAGLDNTGSMVDYLSPQYKSDLTLIGTMPLATEISSNSKYTFDINIDDKKNIVFELGGYTDFPKSYTYVVDQNVIEVGQN